jgi:TPR repeat protein
MTKNDMDIFLKRGKNMKFFNICALMFCVGTVLHASDEFGKGSKVLKAFSKVFPDFASTEEAKKWYASGIESKDPISMINCARALAERGAEKEAVGMINQIHCEGMNTSLLAHVLKDQNKKKAKKLSYKAAKKGYPCAMRLLANFLNDDGYPALAKPWYCKAAEKGDADAMFCLGGLFFHDQGEVALEWFRKAAEKGHLKAMFNLGVILSDQGDAAGAKECFRKAAEEGDTDAMVHLGIILSDQGDATRAKKLYRKAAEKGNLYAMFNLGIILHDQGEIARAKKWFRKAADKGDVKAMFSLGVMLQDQGDAAGAVEWYCKAAEKGNVKAMFNLGVMLQGQGDAIRAKKWFRKAAEEGNADAMYNLGIILHDQGDAAGAKKWFRKAADKGDVKAMFNLGVMLQDQGDVAGAEEWYRKAAEKGDADATNNFIGLIDQKKMAEFSQETEQWFQDRATNGDVVAAAYLIGNNVRGYVQLSKKEHDTYCDMLSKEESQFMLASFACQHEAIWKQVTAVLQSHQELIENGLGKHKRDKGKEEALAESSSKKKRV